jgi:hypothetical protein
VPIMGGVLIDVPFLSFLFGSWVVAHAIPPGCES